ncbi:hypothetical protein AB0B92_13645 [Streptomyces hygroscopicus]|uniref:hypothetical protein n=1 Tax=Streptomyces hygroscopicus TaxID=1912 RepID=UPI003405056C
MSGRAVCSECREPAEESPAVDIAPCWGDPPSWSHEDGSALCATVGTDAQGRHRYLPCEPEFL